MKMTPAKLAEALHGSMRDPDSVPLRIALQSAIPGAVGWDAAECRSLRQELSVWERVFLDRNIEMLGADIRIRLQSLRAVLIGDLTRERCGQLFMELREVWCDPRLSPPFDLSGLIGKETDGADA
jgi:hypothetical protein